MVNITATQQTVLINCSSQPNSTACDKFVATLTSSNSTLVNVSFTYTLNNASVTNAESVKLTVQEKTDPVEPDPTNKTENFKDFKVLLNKDNAFNISFVNSNSANLGVRVNLTFTQQAKLQSQRLLANETNGTGAANQTNSTETAQFFMT